MEESLLLAGLAAAHHQDRAKALEELRTSVRRGKGHLRFRAQDRLFTLLATLLKDTNWNVRRDTISLLSEMVPAAETQRQMPAILGPLIHNMGDHKVAIRRAAISVFENLLAVNVQGHQLVDAIIHDGLENSAMRVRAETLLYLATSQVWLKAESENVFCLLEAVIGRLRDVEQEVVSAACKVLSCVPHILGESTFDAHVSHLNTTLKQLYRSVNQAQLAANPSSIQLSSQGSFRSDRNFVSSNSTRSVGSARPASADLLGDRLEYGFLPAATVTQLRQLGDSHWEARSQAVSEMQRLILKVTSAAVLLPHVEDLLQLCYDLLQDKNLKITLTTLEILGLLTAKAGWPMRAQLKPLIAHLLPLLGDSKVVLRQATTKLIIKLMQTLTPAPVIDLLSPQLTHTSWRVREEIVNTVIIALSTFGRDQFDLPRLASEQMLPSLLDNKDRVRFVGLEVYAVIHNLTGGKVLGRYLKGCHLDDATLQTLEARFQANKLPQINDDGFVQHVTGATSSATSSRGSVQSQSTSERRGVSRSCTPSRTVRAASAKLPWEQQTMTLETDFPSPMLASSPTQGSIGGSYAERFKSRKEKSLTSHHASAANPAPKTATATVVPAPDTFIPQLSSDILSVMAHVPISATAIMSTATARVSRENSFFGVRPAALDPEAGKSSAEIAEPAGSSAKNKPLTAVANKAEESDLPWNRLARPGSRRHGKNLERTLTLPSTPPGLRKSPPTDGAVATITNEVAASTGVLSLTSFHRKPPSLDDDQTANTEVLEFPSGDPEVISPRPPAYPRPAGQGRGSHSPNKRSMHNAEDSPPSTISTTTDAVVQHLPPVTRQLGPTKDDMALSRSQPVRVMTGKDQLSNSAGAKLLRTLSPSTGRGLMSSHGGSAVQHSPPPIRKPSEARVDDDPPALHNESLVHSPPLGTAGRLSGPWPAEGDHGAESGSLIEPSLPSTRRTNFQNSPPSSPPLSPRQSSPGDDARRSAKKSRLLQESNQRMSSGLVGSEYGPGVLTEYEKEFIAQAKAARASEHVPTIHNETTQAQKHSPSPPNLQLDEHVDVFSSPSPTPPSPFSALPARQAVLSSATKKRLVQRRMSMQASPKSTPVASTLAGRVRSNSARRLSSAGGDSDPEPDEPEVLEVESSGGDPDGPTNSKASGVGRPPRAPNFGSSTRNDTSKRLGSLSRSVASSSTGGDQYLIPLHELSRHPNPSTALRDAYAALKRGENQETWMEKCEGLNVIRQLVRHDPGVIRESLRAVLLAVMAEVQNLRSSVARVAISTLADMYMLLGKIMEMDLDKTVAALLNKMSAESGSVFISEETDKALETMVEHLSGKAAATALLGSISHKSKLVRRAVARHLSDLVGATGPRLFMQRECQRILTGLAILTQDQGPETRWFARKAFYTLSSFDDFDTVLAKSLTGTSLQQTQDIVGVLRSKGLGSMPADKQLSRHASTSSTGTTASLRRSGSKRGSQRGLRADSARDATRQALGEITDSLLSSDWRLRDSGISNLEELIDAQADNVALDVQRLFDAFVPRLLDSNSKVNNHALLALQRLVPVLGTSLEPLATQIIPVLAQNLASKIIAIRDAAVDSLKLMAAYMDPSVLAQPVCAAAAFGNIIVMEAMIPVVCDLVPLLHPQHVKLLVKHVIPLAVQLLGESRGGLKTACQTLCRSLDQVLGSELLGYVPEARRKALQAILV